MRLNFRRRNEGLTLVELLLVIVLIAILMALVTLSGANMVQSTNAQTEVRRIIRTVQSLRSAWLACYADTQRTIGVGYYPGSTVVWSDKSIDLFISRYSDRSLTEETGRYGSIDVIEHPADSNRIYIGFNATNDNYGVWGNSKKSGTLDMMRSMLSAQSLDYSLHMTNTRNIYIRIR